MTGTVSTGSSCRDICTMVKSATVEARLGSAYLPLRMSAWAYSR